LTIDAFESFWAVAGNRGRFGKVSAGGAVQTAVVDEAVVDGFVTGGTVETVGTLATKAIGLQQKVEIVSF
jgi:hypothetical protein